MTDHLVTEDGAPPPPNQGVVSPLTRPGDWDSLTGSERTSQSGLFLSSPVSSSQSQKWRRRRTIGRGSRGGGGMGEGGVFLV